MSIELEDITSGYNLSRINSNFQKVEDVLNGDVVWKTGNVAGETLMERDLDMNGNAILNIGVDLDNPDSLLTLEIADARYYNVAGDVLEGTFNANGNKVTGLPVAVSPSDAVRKQELDNEISSRQSADANIQEQLTGNVPLEASAFSEISWHGQQIANSVTIPANKNAWSFGPQMEIEQGQLVTISPGSTWTIANGRVVEDEDLHNLIADTLTTSNGLTTVDVASIPSGGAFSTLQGQVASNTSNIAANTSSLSSVASRISAEEVKVQSVALGGTGATTPVAARTNLGAKANAGVVDASSAATGVVGEYLSNTTNTTSVTSGAVVNATSLVLTAGDWDVSGAIQWDSTAALSTITAGSSLTSATSQGFPFNATIGATITAGTNRMSIPTRRVNISASTTLYAISVAGFASGTCTVNGFLSARRVR